VSKPHRYHDQPEHLEDVLNDINEELYTTEHGLSFGAASLLRFLATIAWTSKTNNPEYYASINPKYAKITAMARMTGASVSSIKRYLKELDGGWIKRHHQYGRDGFRDEDKIWLLWSDADRKIRAELHAATKPDFWESNEAAEQMGIFVVDEPKAKHDNRYWVRRKTGQFWRHDNPKHKVADDDVLVDLSSKEARFFWAKNMDWDTNKRRKVMKTMATHPRGRAVLSRMMDDHEARLRRRGEDADWSEDVA
jgi:hypothetical protein